MNKFKDNQDHFNVLRKIDKNPELTQSNLRKNRF